MLLLQHVGCDWTLESSLHLEPALACIYRVLMPLRLDTGLLSATYSTLPTKLDTMEGTDENITRYHYRVP